MVHQCRGVWSGGRCLPSMFAEATVSISASREYVQNISWAPRKHFLHWVCDPHSFDKCHAAPPPQPAVLMRVKVGMGPGSDLIAFDKTLPCVLCVRDACARVSVWFSVGTNACAFPVSASDQHLGLSQGPHMVSDPCCDGYNPHSRGCLRILMAPIRHQMSLRNVWIPTWFVGSTFLSYLSYLSVVSISPKKFSESRRERERER